MARSYFKEFEREVLLVELFLFCHLTKKALAFLSWGASTYPV
jgi:sulfur transfer complex TusBCD TusB component (DsrH family)